MNPFMTGKFYYILLKDDTVLHAKAVNIGHSSSNKFDVKHEMKPGDEEFKPAPHRAVPSNHRAVPSINPKISVGFPGIPLMNIKLYAEADSSSNFALLDATRSEVEAYLEANGMEVTP